MEDDPNKNNDDPSLTPDDDEQKLEQLQQFIALDLQAIVDMPKTHNEVRGYGETGESYLVPATPEGLGAIGIHEFTMTIAPPDDEIPYQVTNISVLSTGEKPYDSYVRRVYENGTEEWFAVAQEDPEIFKDIIDNAKSKYSDDIEGFKEFVTGSADFAERMGTPEFSALAPAQAVTLSMITQHAAIDAALM